MAMGPVYSAKPGIEAGAGPGRRKMVLPALVLLCALPVCPGAGRGEVERGVSPDGTVHFYNRFPVKKNAPGTPGRDFNSPYISLINRVAMEEGMEGRLVQCIVKVESDFRADAVSVAGAMGLMQLMPETARYYRVTNPFDPEQNLRAGVRHFRGLLKHFGGELPLALAAYHAGLGAVKKRNAVPPIKETIAYVRRVMGLYDPSRVREDGKSIDGSVKKLYQRTGPDGTIDIYSR
ncbi:MAG TPA: lytic transglycosylase domain-containing protein [Spirochaetes bacterium]|nr:lytic transglycosylase domain-containing protein [Spirochaetota bacterium]